MFNRLLTILKRGGTVTVDQMARELETSPEVVSGMIDHMTRQGWLRSMSASCDSTCGECLFARDCTRVETSRVWQPVSIDVNLNKRLGAD
jgi:DNA-binding Lrp family transcriptional regulator